MELQRLSLRIQRLKPRADHERIPSGRFRAMLFINTGRCNASILQDIMMIYQGSRVVEPNAGQNTRTELNRLEMSVLAKEA